MTFGNGIGDGSRSGCWYRRMFSLRSNSWQNSRAYRKPEKGFLLSRSGSQQKLRRPSASEQFRIFRRVLRNSRSPFWISPEEEASENTATRARPAPAEPSTYRGGQAERQMLIRPLDSRRIFGFVAASAKSQAMKLGRRFNNPWISCCATLMPVALVCGTFMLATWGCGFLSMVFKGEDQQSLRETGICDNLASQFAAEVPSLVELRTDKAGNSRYRDIRLAGTEVDPQWVPMPNPHADATGWVHAGNFTKMEFEPPLQPALTPGSVTYVAYAPADARNATEQGQLKALDSAFGPASGSFRWNGRVYRYAAVHKLPCLPPPP
jgi:hypothetical protein